jgi:hypothetical protein
MRRRRICGLRSERGGQGDSDRSLLGLIFLVRMGSGREWIVDVHTL